MNFLFLKYLNFLVLIEFKINIHDSTAPAQIIIFFELIEKIEFFRLKKIELLFFESDSD